MVCTLALSSCAASAFRDVPESEAQPASEEQMRQFDLDDGARVLLDLGPSSHSTDEGPTGSFKYQPYRFRVQCETRIRLAETREYRSWGRLQSDSLSRPADCPAGTLDGGLDNVQDGDTVYVTVVRPPSDSWRVLVVAAD